MGLGSSSNAGAIAQQQQQQQATQVDQASNQIQNAFAGFNQPFYNNIQQSYIDFANPQLTQQYGQQMKQLQGNLSNQGLLNSSAAGNLTGQLNQQLAQQQQGVVNSGIQQAQQEQQQIQGQENTLLNQAIASSDPLSVAQGALSAASSIRPPSLFAPVGNFFSNWASQYQGNQQANQLANLNNQLSTSISSGYLGSPGFGFAPLGSAGTVGGTGGGGGLSGNF